MTTFSNKQVYQQKQSLKLSALQLQVLGLIQLNALELDERIKEEIIENPAIEEITPTEREEREASVDNFDDFDANFDDKSEKYRESDDLSDYEKDSYYQNERETHFQLSETTTFREKLKERLSLVTTLPNEKQKIQLAQFIVDNLDDDGYLRTSLWDLCDNLAFHQSIFVELKDLEEALAFLQQQEPLGIGARDLRECLLLQLNEAKASPASTLAYSIIDEHFDTLSNRNFERLKSVLQISDKDLKNAIAYIAHLRPKPITETNSSESNKSSITPDFLIQTEGEHFLVALNGRQYRNDLRISPNMLQTLEQVSTDKKEKKDRKAKETTAYLRSKINDAQNFIVALQQREQSMLSAIRVIVALQQDYFRTGDIRLLKPMILKDVAEKCDLDVSTISRVTSSKYAQTDFGIIRLKDLFSQATTHDTTGEMVSNKVLQDLITEIIDKEDKQNPYNDETIAELLQERGFSIARRTVAKYREQLHIPTMKMRKIF